MSANQILNILRQNKSRLSQLGASRIGLFGSQLRDDATADSDLDLIVEFDHGKKSFDNYIDLCFYLEELFQKKVDLLTPESLSPHMKDHILREARYENIH